VEPSIALENILNFGSDPKFSTRNQINQTVMMDIFRLGHLPKMRYTRTRIA